jgi:N utilization substance protein B
MTTDEKPARSRHAMSRSLTRLAGIQALFQIDRRGLDPHSVIEEFRMHRLGDADLDEGQPDLTRADRRQFASLVLGTMLRAEEIDGLIDAVLPRDWARDRLDPVIRAILRAGCFELLAREDVPTGVAIDEYVSIARAFFAETEAGFVNGVLGALARRLRPDLVRAGDAVAAPG